MDGVEECGDAADGWPTPSALRRPDRGHEAPGEAWTTEFRISALVTVIDVVVAASSSLAGLVRADRIPPDGIPPGDTSIILAMQAAGPRLALAGVCVLAVRVGSRAALTALGTVAGLLQGFDAALGAVQGDGVMTIVPALLAMAQCCVLVLLDISTPPRGGIGGP